MEYESDFHRSFMVRTQKNLENYRGDYEATQAINSLLGLLIVPKEKLFAHIPDDLLTDLGDAWGTVSQWIRNPGKCDHGHRHPLTLRQLVRRLRNAVAYFKISPYPAQGEIQGFKFSDRNGFSASIPVTELRRFVVKLAMTLIPPTAKEPGPC